MMIKRPLPQDYPQAYQSYIRLIKNEDVISVLENQKTAFHAFVKNIDSISGDHRYAEGKWTVKEVVGHVIEVERVMAYRALAISRGDQQSLPGMDENTYIANSNYTDRTFEDLAEEFKFVRKSNIQLFRSFTQEMVERKGTANSNTITVAALIYVIAGHLDHHVQIIRDRYLRG